MLYKQQKFFITGTDTNIGKTYICKKILEFYNKKNYQTIALKPISTGGNADAIILQQAASIKLPLAIINPFAFTPPIAPHIAAKNATVNLTVKKIYKQLQPTLFQPYDYLLIEGVGGWQVPLNQHETILHLAKKINFPIILVVGVKLGCINHALLTATSIIDSGANLHGWVANCLEPNMPELQENINYLNNKIIAPLLAIVDYTGDCELLSDSDL